IIQNDVGNHYAPTLIVAAITSQARHHLPVQVEIKAPEGGLERDSLVLLNQIRTIDKARLGRYWGSLGPESMARVNRALMISLGLVPL
ncbi:MAG: type II toxin-antitoxin system PemK/MazF family toxin, partial [Dehalococcoidia bacterium]|nr:type II toxin-antitoxin system PemK/MazF family toxin [Dehalococcoidia bacterium]